MWRCHHPRCTGHDEWFGALSHTLEHIVTTLDELAQDFATYKTDVTTKLDALQAEIAAQGPETIPADVQAKIDDLDATIKGADSALTTPAAETTTPSDTAPADDTPAA